MENKQALEILSKMRIDLEKKGILKKRENDLEADSCLSGEEYHLQSKELEYEIR